MPPNLVPVLLLTLYLTLGSVHSQRSTQEASMIQYFQGRLAQMEERLSQCEQKSGSMTQRIYDLSTEVRNRLSIVDVLRSEVRGQLDGVSMRVDRVERELEYLENTIPTQANIEMEEALLEQQTRDAQVDQLKKKAKISLQNDCSTTLTEVKSLKIVRRTGDTHGSWFRDPSKGSAKIYFLSGFRNDTVLEYVSLKSFIERNSSQLARVIKLPFHWQGTGHMVYNGFIYYHNADTANQILKVDVLNGTLVDSTLLAGAGRLPVYSLNPNTYLDLAVDELGLWVIHADPDYAGNLVITKLDKASLAAEHTWDTRCRSHNAEGSFLICGTLYVVYNTGYGGRSNVQCLYDIHDTIHSLESPVLFFPKRYTSHASMYYHPKDKQLYAWDDGYQTIYKLETRRKEQVITSSG